jgi:hypothetical protein
LVFTASHEFLTHSHTFEIVCFCLLPAGISLKSDDYIQLFHFSFMNPLNGLLIETSKGWSWLVSSPLLPYCHVPLRTQWRHAWMQWYSNVCVLGDSWVSLLRDCATRRSETDITNTWACAEHACLKVYVNVPMNVNK